MEETMNTRQLQDAVKGYQSGVSSDAEDFSLNFDDAPEENPISTDPPGGNKISLRDAILSRPIGANAKGVVDTEDTTEEALKAGYGDSKYDTTFYNGLDLEDARSREQSGARQVVFGIAKGGVTAAATALNTTLGTVFGVATSLYQLGKDAMDRSIERNGDVSIIDTLDLATNKSVIDAGVNNWLSSQLTKLQTWSDEVMPNYRTEEELSDEYQRQWWPHFLNANYIGDSLLKNFGFTVGAMYGGSIWTGVIGKVQRMKLANDILKGATVAAEGDAEASATLKRAAEALKRGTAIGIEEEQLLKNISSTARKIKGMEARLQLYGAAIGALGEGNMEGLMARQEFIDDYSNRWNEEYAKEYDSIEDEILQSGNTDLVDYLEMENANGETVAIPVGLKDAGQAELLRRQMEVTKKYRDLRDEANKQGDRLAGTTFMLNQLILVPSNLVQFGRMFSGGWKTSKKGFSQYLKRLFAGEADISKKSPKGLRGGVKVTKGVKPSVSSNFAAEYNVTGNTILNTLKVMGSEAAEELLQGMASSGMKNVGEARLSSFNDDGYDAAEISDFLDGAINYISDRKNWQEGMLGALTGLLGIPGRHWHGGVFEAYKDAKSMAATARDAAEKLNTLVNSKEFQDRWHGYIRHRKYDRQMQDALEKDDEYMWHNADEAQLISDVVAFADNGRLDDLLNIVDGFANLSEKDANDIKALLKEGTKDNDDFGWAKNLSAKEIVDKVKDQANNIKIAIDDYKNLYDALSVRAPENASPEFIKELVATAMTIKNRERRFMTLFGEVFDGVRDENGKVVTPGLDSYLTAVSQVTENGEVLDQENEEVIRKAETLRDNFEKLFGSLMPLKLTTAFNKKIAKVLDELDEMTSKIDPELNKKIADLKKLAESRQEYYYKLQTLQSTKGWDQFNRNAVTQQKVNEASVKAQSVQEVSALKSFNDIREAYRAKETPEDIAEFMKNLENAQESNPVIKRFLNLKKRHDDFNAYTEKNGLTSDSPMVSDEMMRFIINGLFDSALNLSDYETATGSASPSWSAFHEQFKDATVEDFHDAVKSVKTMLSNFMKTQVSTQSRKDISKRPVNPNPAPGTVNTPDGYDASQPGSLEPAPGDGILTVGMVHTLSSMIIADNFADEKNTEVFDYIKGILSQVLTGQTSPESLKNATRLILKKANSAPQMKISQAIFRLLGITQEKPAEEVKESAEEQPEQPAEKENEPVAEEPTQEEENDDNLLAVMEDEDEPEEKSDKRERFSYRTSTPETDQREARKVRDGEKASYEADLRNFPETEYGKKYKTTWDELDGKGAFKTLAEEVKEGDKVYFMIDPAFPPFNGKPQILMAIERDGKKLVFGVLGSDNASESFKGLASLRDEIESEYERWQEEHPTDIYTYATPTIVYKKKNGVLDFSRQKTDKDIREIAGYDADAVIAVVDRNGNVVNAKTGKAIECLPENFKAMVSTSEREGGTGRSYVGNLYYLSKNGDKFIPIRLGVRHFDHFALTENNKMFQKVNEILTNIEQLVRATSPENIEEQNKKLHEFVNELGKYLDVHDIFFEIGEYDKIGPALKIVTGYRSKEQKAKDVAAGTEVEDNEKDVFRRPDQMEDGWLRSFVSKLDRSMQTRFAIEAKEGQNMTTVPNIDELKENGMLVSNANWMRQRNADVRLLPYNAEEGMFEPMTDFQRMKIDEITGARPEGDIEHSSDSRAQHKDVSVNDDAIDDDSTGEEWNYSENAPEPMEWMTDEEAEQRLGMKLGAISLDQTKTMFHSFAAGSDPSFREFADKVFGVAKSLGISISVLSSNEFLYGVDGRYRNGNVSYNADFLASDRYTPEKKANLVLHEIIHAVTVYSLEAYRNNPEKLTPEMKEAINTFNQVYDIIKNEDRFKSFYAIKSVDEMVAELGNPLFRRALKERNLWRRIIDGIKRLFGISQSDAIMTNALTELDKALDKVLSGFDSTLYNEYRKKGLNTELEEIKREAIANGTFMKAPNGNSTNLEEKQWLQVRTKAFKNWFGDWENDPANASKVVDENGEPLVVYRTGSETDGNLKSRLKGFYFTASKKYAEAYIRDYENVNNTIAAFLNIRNLKTWKEHDIVKKSNGDIDPARGLFQMLFNEQDVQDLLGDSDGGHWVSPDEWLVINPNQIKSATDNSGAFSTEDNNIYNHEVTETDPANQYVFDNTGPAYEKFSEVPARQQQWLKEKGYTEEMFNSMPQGLRDQVMRCL